MTGQAAYTTLVESVVAECKHAIAEGRVIAIEAAHGWGRQALVDELSKGTAGETAVAADIDHWPGNDVEHFIVDRLGPSEHRPTIVTACEIPVPVVRHLVGRPHCHVRSRDLRLADDHVSETLVGCGASPTSAQQLTRLIDGWPRALRGTLSVTAGELNATASFRHRAFRDISQRLTTHLDDDQRFWLSQLAHLREVLPCDRFGAPDTYWSDYLRSDVPLFERADGRWSLVQVVRDLARSWHSVDIDAMRAFAESRQQAGEQLSAVGLLSRVGDLRTAARMLTQMAPHVVEESSPTELLRIVNLLQPVHNEFPRIMLIGARAHCAMLHLNEERRLLEQATGDSHNDDAVRREAQAEITRNRLMSAQPEADATIIEVADADNPTAQALWHETQATLLCLDIDDLKGEAAIAAFENAAQIWTTLGRPSRAAYALRGMAMAALTDLGRYSEATEVLLRALDLTPHIEVERARTLTSLWLVRAQRGMLSDEVALAEAQSGAHEYELKWGLVLLSRARVLMNIVRGELDAAATAARSAIRELGQLMMHPAKTVVHAEFAEYYAWFGHLGEASSHLAAAQPATDERDLDSARLALAACAGDVDTVNRLATSLAANRQYLGWKRDAALLLVNQAPDFCTWERVITDAAATGADELAAAIARRHETGKAGAGADDDDGSGTGKRDAGRPPGRPTASRGRRADQATSGGTLADSVRIEMLGKFAIVDDRGSRLVATSKAVEAIQAIAIYDGSMLVDVLLEWLWPDLDLQAGRRRLKNVVLRAKSLVQQRLCQANGMIWFDTGVTTDLGEFTRAARSASMLSHDGDPDAVVQLTRALQLYGGDLLPGRRYDDAIQPIRRRLTEQALGLLKTLLTLTNDAALAPFLLDRWETIDPLDFVVAGALISWLEDRGLRREAEFVATTQDALLDGANVNA